MLIDSHCHLDMLGTLEDIKTIVLKAKQNGVSHMQTICTNLENFPNILKISEMFDNVFASVGIHPNEVKEKITDEQLINLSHSSKVIGLGETGLDYYYHSADRLMQIHSFTQHITASQKTNLPIIIHMRDAEEDIIDILTSEINNAPFHGLIHCFTASKTCAQKILDLGLYISISGIVTFNNAEFLRDIVRFVPLNRLLLETDSPYLAPVPMRGKPNEPALVKHVAEKIAEIKATSIEEVEKVTSANFFHLFTKATH